MTDHSPSLKRTIGLFSLTLYGIGDMLGSGIYGLIGKAAGEMGNVVWLAFLTSMIAAGLTGLSYASLGSRYPKAGGTAYAVQRAFKNNFLSYVIGLAVLSSGLTSMATAAKVFSGYFSGLFGLSPTSVSLVFSIVIALVVFWGIKESIFANGLCTFVEVGGLLFILIIGFSYLGSVNYLDATSILNPSGEITYSLILGGAVLTFYSFVGFEDALNVAEEVKNPTQTIPKALLSAICVASIIYMGISLVAVSVLPASQLAASSQPLVDVVSRAAPWFPLPAFSLIAMFAVSNTALLNFIMGSRLLYGMSKQHLVPSFLSQVHSGRRTPHLAIVFIWACFVILILSGDISSLAKATSVLLLICFIVVNISLVILKKRESMEASFNVPSWVPALGAIVCFAMLSKAQWPEWKVAGLILLIISIVYFIVRPDRAAIEHLDDL